MNFQGRGEQVDRLELHPLRAWMLWPEYVAAMQRVGNEMGLVPTGNDLDKTSEVMRRIYNDAIMKVPFEQRPSGQMHYYQLLERGFRVASLAAAGMNIYTLAPDLRNALGRSQLGDVRLGDLRAPYSTFYIGFEQGSGVFFHNGDNVDAWVVDGAYVMSNTSAREGDHIWNICLTCRNRLGLLTPGYSEHWAVQEEPHFTFDLKGSAEATFEDALGEALVSGNLDLEPDYKAIDQFRASIVAQQDEAASRGMRIVTPVISSREKLAQFKSANFASARNALALMLGAICALTSKPDVQDIELEWPKGAPMDLISESQNAATPKARQRAAGGIKRQGFAPIRRIDLSAFGGKAHNGELASDGRSIRAHWRAGHFRRQHYGVGRSLVTVRWIMPTVVNAGQGPLADGRVYRVSKGDGQNG